MQIFVHFPVMFRALEHKSLSKVKCDRFVEPTTFKDFRYLLFCMKKLPHVNISDKLKYTVVLLLSTVKMQDCVFAGRR